MLLNPRNGAAHDLPPAQGRTYVVASTPRSGSTLLSHTLTATGRAGAPLEYLNPTQLRDWEVRLGGPVTRVANRVVWPPIAERIAVRAWSRARLAAHLERVRTRRTCGGWFGIKLHHHHLARWESHGHDPVRLLAPDRYVRIVREDRVAQAVSWVLALQTRRWAVHERARLPAVYVRGWIERAISWIDDADRSWDARLAGQRVATVRFEDLVADHAGTIREVLAFLDAPTDAVPPPPIPRQGTALNDAWIARYREGR